LDERFNEQPEGDGKEEVAWRREEKSSSGSGGKGGADSTRNVFFFETDCYGEGASENLEKKEETSSPLRVNHQSIRSTMGGGLS